MDYSKWYESSSGAGLSMSIGGFSVMGISQAVMMAFGLFGHPVDQDAVSSFIVAVLTSIGGLMTAFGLARKIYHQIRPA